MLYPQPRDPHDRRIRRKVFKSAFVRPPQTAPFKYLLNTREFCAAYGVSERTAALWRKQWVTTGYHTSPQPRNYSNNRDPEYRYLYDEVLGLPEGTWLARFKAQQKVDFVVTEKSHQEAIA
jgi:hypothetical protein